MVDRLAVGKASDEGSIANLGQQCRGHVPGKVNHALGESYLAQTCVLIIARSLVGAGAAIGISLRFGGFGKVEQKLVAKGVIGRSQRGTVNG